MSVFGDSHEIRGTAAAATVTQNGPFAAVVGTGPITSIANQFGPTQYTWSGPSSIFKYAGYWTDLLVGWSPYSIYRGEGAPYVGFASNPVTPAQLSGLYSLLGQRCTVGTTTCTPVTASAAIDATGKLAVCYGVAYSPVCTDGANLQLTSTDPVNAGVYTLGDRSARLLAAVNRGSLAFTFQEVHGVGPVTRYTFFGNRTNLNYYAGLSPNIPFVYFTQAQSQREDTPDILLNGSTDGTGSVVSVSDGNRWLRSTEGQLIYWSGTRKRLEIYWQRP